MILRMEQAQYAEDQLAPDDIKDQEDEEPTLLDILNEDDDAEETGEDYLNYEEQEADDVDRDYQD